MRVQQGPQTPGTRAPPSYPAAPPIHASPRGHRRFPPSNSPAKPRAPFPLAAAKRNAPWKFSVISSPGDICAMADPFQVPQGIGANQASAAQRSRATPTEVSRKHRETTSEKPAIAPNRRAITNRTAKAHKRRGPLAASRRPANPITSAYPQGRRLMPATKRYAPTTCPHLRVSPPEMAVKGCAGHISRDCGAK